MQLTTFAATTNLLWKYLAENGYDPEPLYLGAGINPALLKTDNARIPVASVDRLWEAVLAKLADPCLGVKMNHYWHPSQLGALGYAWLVSSSLRTALNRVVRYSHVVAEDLYFDLRETPAGLQLVFDTDRTTRIHPEQIDLVLAIVLHMCRFNAGDHLVPVEVQLPHPRQACAEVIDAYFQCRLVFDADSCSITFALDDVDTYLDTANRQLALMHDEILMKYLIEIKKGDLIEQIKSIIIDHFPDGKVTDAMVASKLNMSERSLQRRLKEKGTCFRAILECVRKMVALQYIKDPENRLTDIAFLIGFSEQSAFSRAFKKWTGLPPLKYRESLFRQNASH